MLIAVALITLTGFASAFLNDVTAILLIAPLSIQIALVIGVHPFAIVIAEELVSNIGDVAGETGRVEEVERFLSGPKEGDGNG